MTRSSTQPLGRIGLLAALDGTEPSAGHGRAVLSQRVRPLVVTLLTLLAIFTGFRIALCILQRPVMGAVAWRDLAHSFLLGLKFDLRCLGYLLLPMGLALTLAPAPAFGRRWFRWVLTGYASLLALLTVAVEIVGTAFFLYFGRRLNDMAINYVSHVNETFGYILSQYPVWLLVPIMLAGLCGSFLLYRRLFWRGPAPRRRPFSRAVHCGAFAAVCLLAIRGGFGAGSLREAGGNVYFCDNNLVGELSRNNLSSFAAALWRSAFAPLAEDNLFDFPSPQEGGRRVAEMLYQPQDVSLGDPVNPLWRQTETHRPMEDLNVVVIIMESMAGRSVGALGHEPSHTPRLDALTREGTYFDNMYAVGHQTQFGLSAILCGHPGLLGKPLMKRPEAVGGCRTLPTLFGERGYRTMFFYGGDAEFDNMEGFLARDGISELYCEESMPPGPRGGFGNPYHDEVVFEKVHEVFNSVSPDERFFAVVLTLTNHDPWEAPEGRVALLPTTDEDTPENRHAQMVNTYRYADWCLGRFFDRAREEQAPWLNKTLFVLVADHGQRFEFDRTRVVDAPSFRVPCLFYAPGRPDLTPPIRVSTVCSQTDVSPTLINRMGGSWQHAFMGRDVLSVTDGGFAMLRDNEPLASIVGDRLMVLPPRNSPRVYGIDQRGIHPAGAAMDDAEHNTMRDDMLAYFGLARYLVGQRALERPRTNTAAAAGSGEVVGRRP